MFHKLKNFNIVRALKLEKLKIPVIIGLAIGVFIAVNIFISPISLRLDFSFGAAYTLSNSTKKILQKLDNGVTIKLFASSDLPTRVIPVKNEVVDLLNEYKKTNTGKITVKFLDPKKDQSAAKDAQDLGIPELQFSSVEKDKYAVSSSYFAIAITYKDKKEIMPQITDVESLEYNLTSMIYKLTRNELIKIGIMGKEPSFDPQTDDISVIKKIFEQQYDTGYIDLTTKSSINVIDPSYKTILIFDTNKKEYEEKEINAINAYLDNNGKVIIFSDGVWIGDSLSAAPANHNLYALLDNHGLKLNRNLVLSTSAELVNFGNSMEQFMSLYPFWLRTNMFNPKISYFSNVNQLTFPWVSSISPTKVEGWESQPIIQSSNKSWEQIEASGSAIILDPQAIPQPQPKDLKSFVLVAESKKKGGGTIMLIPSSRFILDRFITKTSNNLEFVLNVVGDYASGGVLSGIHQRVVSFFPLPELADNEKDILKYADILALPLLFGLIGGIILFKRR